MLANSYLSRALARLRVNTRFLAIALTTTALATTAPATVDTTAPYVLVARHSGKAMQVQSTSDGAAVVQSVSGYYRLKSTYSGKVVEVTSSSTANSATVAQWTDTNATNQQFSLADSITVGQQSSKQALTACR